jgi:hypothetical protein
MAARPAGAADALDLDLDLDSGEVLAEPASLPPRMYATES